VVKVVDIRGRFISNVNVVLEQSGDRSPDTRQKAEPEGHGRYTFHEVPHGEYVVSCSALGQALEQEVDFKGGHIEVVLTASIDLEIHECPDRLDATCRAVVGQPF